MKRKTKERLLERAAQLRQMAAWIRPGNERQMSDEQAQKIADTLEQIADEDTTKADG